MNRSEPCNHKLIYRQVVDPILAGDNYYFRCHECGQKFLAQEWDGKIQAVPREESSAISAG